MSDQQLSEELYKPNIIKFSKRKTQSPFIEKIWGADLADMQFVSEFNNAIRLLLCVIDIYSKYAWVIPVKDKKGELQLLFNDNYKYNAFQKISNETRRKSNKI